MPIRFKFDASASDETRRLMEGLARGLDQLGFSARSVTVTVHSDPNKLSDRQRSNIADRGGNGTFNDGTTIFINPNADLTGTSLAKTILHELIHVYFPGLAGPNNEFHDAAFYKKLGEACTLLSMPMAERDLNKWLERLRMDGKSNDEIAKIVEKFGPKCFLAGTPILMADGSLRAIEKIDVGDLVLSFDPDQDNGRGALVPRRVTRLFRNVTDHVYAVPLAPGLGSPHLWGQEIHVTKSTSPGATGFSIRGRRPSRPSRSSPPCLLPLSSTVRGQTGCGERRRVRGRSANARLCPGAAVSPAHG